MVDWVELLKSAVNFHCINANSLQISKIELIFTKYSNPAFYNICYNDTLLKYV